MSNIIFNNYSKQKILHLKICLEGIFNNPVFSIFWEQTQNIARICILYTSRLCVCVCASQKNYNFSLQNNSWSSLIRQPDDTLYE